MPNFTDDDFRDNLHPDCNDDSEFEFAGAFEKIETPKAPKSSRRDASGFWFRKNRYVTLPSEAFGDPRLSRADLAVLGALASFADKETGYCYPKRDKLCAITGLTAHQISRATTRLRDYGWLRKQRKPRTAFYWLSLPTNIPQTWLEIKID